MGKTDWEVVTAYADAVTTSLKTVSFPKVQEQVYLRNQGNANFTYTIGSQSGTLTPGQSVTVNQDVSSFTLQAVSGTHTFELRAKEKGTEIEEAPSDVPSQIASLTSSLAENMKQSLEIKKQKYSNKTTIVFIDDDANKNLITIQKPFYDSLGIVGCAAVPTAFIGANGYCTLSDLEMLRDAGWELLNHTNNHINLSTLTTEEEIRKEIEDCTKKLNEIGAKGSNILVYPNGGYNTMVKKVTKETMDVGLTVYAGINYRPILNLEMYRVNSAKDGGVYFDYDTLVTQLDSALAKGGLMVVMSHSWQDFWSKPEELQKFRDFIAYARTKNVEFKTMTEVLEEWKNVIDVGDNAFKVGIDGSIGGNSLDIKCFEQIFDYSISGSTPSSYFKLGINTIIYLPSRYAVNKGFPTNDAGTLITYRPNAPSGDNPNNATYQTYRPILSNITYTRYWIVSSSTWSAWVDMAGDNFIKVLAMDSVTNSTPITSSSFASGFITINQISYNVY
jgi:peptidoglycan/xylan/chitin deacetylase (PgdA/CDA1 family)